MQNEFGLVTQNDIADRLGVSRGTVYRALNNKGRVSPETVERIVKCAQEMGYKPNTIGRGLVIRKKKLQFGFCYTSGEKVVFSRKIYESARECAERLQEYGVTVRFFSMSLTDCYDLDYVRAFAEQNQMDGWVMSGLFGDHYIDVMHETGRELPPIVAFNLDIKERIAYVGCDYIQAGRLACGLAGLMSGRAGIVGIISFFSDTIATKQRLEGFELEMKESYPGMRIADRCFLKWDMDQFDVFLAVKNLIERNPDINVIFLANPSDYSVITAIHKVTSEKIPIITYDVESRQLIELIKNDKVVVTIGQEPDKQGSVPLEILFDYVAYGTKPAQEWYKTDLSIHIKQNI